MARRPVAGAGGGGSLRGRGPPDAGCRGPLPGVWSPSPCLPHFVSVMLGRRLPGSCSLLQVAFVFSSAFVPPDSSHWGTALGLDQPHFLHPQPALLQPAHPHSSAAPGPDHTGAEACALKSLGGRESRGRGWAGKAASRFRSPSLASHQGAPTASLCGTCSGSRGCDRGCPRKCGGRCGPSLPGLAAMALPSQSSPPPDDAGRGSSGCRKVSVRPQVSMAVAWSFQRRA